MSEGTTISASWRDKLKGAGARILTGIFGKSAPEPETAEPKWKQLEIVKWPAPILKQEAKPVTTFGDQNMELIQRMVETMKRTGACGLAAPQVGVGRRLILCASGKGGAVPMANPVIIAKFDSDPLGDGKKPVLEEGCMSFPGHKVRIKRYHAICVQFNDPFTGELLGLESSGAPARTIQHEIDHLDGITILDHALPNQRKRIDKDMRAKLERQEEKKARRARVAG